MVQEVRRAVVGGEVVMLRSLVCFSIARSRWSQNEIACIFHQA